MLYKSNFNLIAIKGRTWSVEDLPNKAIALDGAVPGCLLDTKNQKYIFDHHGDNRISCRSACSQVLHSLLTGLNSEGFTVFINHLDSDVLLSLTLLKYPFLAMYDDIGRFVELAGLSDSFGPSYPKSEKTTLLLKDFHQEVLAPLNALKRSEKYREIKDLRPLSKKLINRCKEFLLNRIAPNSPMLSRLMVPGSNIVMLESNSSILNSLYKSGISAGVVYRKLSEDLTKYTIFKQTDFLDSCLQIPQISEELDKLEPGWGGTSTLCCSPLKGSLLKPKNVWEVFLNHIRVSGEFC